MRAKPFTRIYGRPSHRDYRHLKQECIDIAMTQEVAYNWANEYRLMTGIVGAEEYEDLINIQTYQAPQKPTVYNQAVNENHEVQKQRRLEAKKDELRESWTIQKRFFMGVLTTSGTPLMRRTTNSSCIIE